MTTLRLVLGDQLSRSLSALRDIHAERDVVLMVEVAEETTYVGHHRQKLVLVLSAMRHFAAALRAEGLRVDYVQLDDRANRGSFGGELARACERHAIDRVVATEPDEWRVARGGHDANLAGPVGHPGRHSPRRPLHLLARGVRGVGRRAQDPAPGTFLPLPAPAHGMAHGRPPTRRRPLEL